jgi:hypothetical protein
VGSTVPRTRESKLNEKEKKGRAKQTGKKGTKKESDLVVIYKRRKKEGKTSLLLFEATLASFFS